MDFDEEELTEILNIFRVESEEIIERLNSALLELEKTPENKDLIVLLFRDAHSLKGAARMIGFTNTQNLAHKMEDILGLAKDNELKLTPSIADLFYKTVDLISKIISQSIDSGKEIFDFNEYNLQIKLLEDLNTTKVETETTQEVQQTPVQEESAGGFNKQNLIKYFDEINSLIVHNLIYIIKLTDKIDESSIRQVLKDTTKLLEIFEKINDFDIKTILENIKLKLDVIEKCHTELTAPEVDEMQQEMDKLINLFIDLSENNYLEPIDYYSYAFDGKEYNANQTSSLETNAEIVETPEEETNDEIEAIKIEAPSERKTLNIDIDNIVNKIKSLENSMEFYNELNLIFTNLKSQFTNSEISPILDKILDLLTFIKNTNANIDESTVDILTTSTEFCFSFINKEKTSGNLDLILQQLTVAKQLIEISQVADVAANEIANVKTQPANAIEAKPNTQKTQQKVKDFSKLFDTGEIKTLHVESSKLDLMVNQIGELIATKIKTTKQLSELNNVDGLLEDWQKDFSKLLRHMKLYDKKNSNQETDSDSSSAIFIKQILNTLTEQSKKLNKIVSTINQLQHSNMEDDMKMRLLIDDFGTMVKNIRVLPLATVFHLFGRMVRDIAKERGKEIELTITGSETSADKKIIEEIKNPLIHILRNSVDHGIETPERRKELGKSPIGHIQINAKHLDNKISIEVIDDGQGFNIEKIKDKAIKKGFLTEEEIANMTDEDVMNIVFYPGFTTGEEVTSISGRGVGMDVVKSKIAQLNGTVKVISEFNKGSRIQIELPVTMATLTAFLIQASNQTFAIPMSVINTVVCKSSEEILLNHDILTILHHDKNIPVYDLAHLLDLPTASSKKGLKTIIVIETNNKTIGIIVDKLLGEQEILHKKLSPPLYRLKNISGITTLASGETCLILNTIDLINNSNLQNAKKVSVNATHTLVDKKALFEFKKILVVDDSITTRTLEKNILEGAGFNIQTSVNPIEALKLINQTYFDLILTDIEMPQMSGLEFLAQLKSNELYSDIPVVVMSSIDNETTRRKACSLGAEKYVVKGEFNQKSFIEMVSNIIIKYSD